MTARRHGSQKTIWLVYALSVGCLLALWQSAAVIVHAPLILPEPLFVLRRLVALAQMEIFWQHVAKTFVRVVKSAAIVCVSGALVGIACGMNKTVRAFVAFPLAIIRATPVVSFILLALFWLGADSVPIFCAVLMAFPVMTTAVSAGFENLDAKLLEMARVFRFSRKQIVRYVYVDTLKAFFASGALSAFGMSWKVVAAGEVLSVPRRALGSLMQSAQVHLETADVLAVSIALVVLSVAAEQLFRVILRVFLRRRPTAADIPANAADFSVPTAAEPIAVRDFSVSFGEKKLYDHFSFAAAAGERVALLAPSGAGKTTLLLHIAHDGKHRVSYAFQEPRLLLQCTILQNVLLPLQNVLDGATALARARQVLHAVGLGARLSAFPDELSGGEKQRVALARALAFPSGILLLDEAFQSQDVHIKQELIALVKNMLASEPRTLVLVTHDPREAMALSGLTVVLGGVPVRTVLDEPTDWVSEEKIRKTLSAYP